MLSERKIRMMTRLAAMEEKDGKEFKQGQEYYRSDYIAVRLIQNGIRLTLGYLLGGGLYLAYCFATLPDSATLTEYVNIGILMVIVYLVLLFGGLFITYVQAVKSYFRVQKQLQKRKVMMERLAREKDGDDYDI